MSQTLAIQLRIQKQEGQKGASNGSIYNVKVIKNDKAK